MGIFSKLLFRRVKAGLWNVNRIAVVVKPKQPYVDWANGLPDETHKNTLSQMRKYGAVFLLPDTAFFASENVDLVEHVAPMMFCAMLNSWYRDTDLWPKDITFKAFKKWFEYEIVEEVLDTMGYKISKEEYV